VALGELLAVGAVEEREVRVDGRRGAQRLQDHYLARGVREVVGPADHVRDAHVDVVHRDREVVERAAVRPGDDEVVDRGVVELDLAADHVGHRRLPALRHAQPHRAVVEVRVATGDQPLDLLLVARAALGL
jgi:hypothetical protein